MTGKPEPSEERNQAVYDLVGFAAWERSRVAAVFGITRERVDQIVSRENYRRARKRARRITEENEPVR